MKRTSGIILSLLLFLSLSLPAQERDRTELEQALRTLVERKRAETGIAVILNGTDTVTVNDAGRYPMMSVFKFHQALAVADFLDRNGLPLSTPLPIRESDLLPDTYSPLRDAYPQGGIEMSIGELLVYTLQLSDNNACDLLFRYIGGPTAADRYIRTLGIEGFAVEATEEEMHRDLTACYRNWSHPLDAARLLEMLITRPLFRDASLQEFIIRTMTGCNTGPERLPKPLAATGAVIGHKTGSGDRNSTGALIGTNDIGFVQLPDGQHYTIAVFVKDSQESLQETERIIAEASDIDYRYMERQE